MLFSFITVVKQFPNPPPKQNKSQSVRMLKNLTTMVKVTAFIKNIGMRDKTTIPCITGMARKKPKFTVGTTREGNNSMVRLA